MQGGAPEWLARSAWALVNTLPVRLEMTLRIAERLEQTRVGPPVPARSGGDGASGPIGHRRDLHAVLHGISRTACEGM
ncbi:MAG: hypothetical protein KF901_29730 [Myxococcales bacterium]|nr:hypothetical protein [Myxococcales bacterium]